MEHQEISQLIETSMEAILSGRASLDDILRQNPEYADQLRPELEIAMWLVSNRDAVRTRPGFVKASRKRVVEQIRQEASRSGTKRAFLGFVWPKQLAFQWAAALVVIFMVFAGTGTVFAASQGALPGEPLYPVKRSIEQVSFALSSDPVRRVLLSNEYADRRLDEAETLLVRASYENAEDALVEFTQEVERTMVLLDEIEDSKPREKKHAAVLLSENLADQAERIDILAQSVNDPVREDLNQARDVSNAGAKFAFGVVEQIEDGASTPTLLPSETFTSTATQTLQPTATSVPATETPEPPTAVSPDETAQPEGKPGKPEDTNMKTPRPTKDTKPTAKPTNENRPPKPDESPKDPPGSGGGESGSDKGGGSDKGSGKK